MISKLLLRASLLVAAVIAPLFPTAPALAQSPANSGFAAQISPLPILLDAKPGTSVGTDLRVNNPSTHAEKLKVVVKTFTQDGPAGTVNLHDPSSADNFISWIHFSKSEFDAPPGLWQTVHMTIDVPATAAFGYYFAVEFTSANPPTGSSSGNTAKIQGAVASFVLLNAQAAGEKKQLSVTSFTADHKSYEFLPVNFNIRLHNSGNIYAGASGNIFIMRGSKQVGVLTVNGNHGLILPNSNRVFTTSWGDGFPVYQPVYGSDGKPVLDKNGKPKLHLTWNFAHANRLRFGHYTAKLALVYNDGQRDIPISGAVSFWVIPWRVVGAIAALLILIAGLITYVIILRRRLKRAGHISKGQPQ